MCLQVKYMSIYSKFVQYICNSLGPTRYTCTYLYTFSYILVEEIRICMVCNIDLSLSIPNIIATYACVHTYTFADDFGYIKTNK